MFKRIINYSVAAAMCLFVATSCAKDDAIDGDFNDQTGTTVEVPFTFSIDGMKAGNAGISQLSSDGRTRLIPDGIVDDENAPISNLWVIQFEGTALDSKIVGVPHFISEADINAATQTGVVQLMASGPCYVVWIANHPQGGYSWGLSGTSTFADVTSKMTTISLESETFGTADDGSTKIIMMNAITDVAIDGTTLEPEFKRNVAKVTLDLAMDDLPATQELEIVSVRLRNIPRNITLADQALSLLGEVGTDIIYPYGSPTIDYEPLTAAEVTARPYPTKGTSQTYSWYVPRNQQGVRAANTVNADKSYYAPTAATYFEIVVRDKSAAKANETAIFRVYPGANQYNDYNIEPNHSYTTKLNIVGMGDSETIDSRVENFADVIGVDANSYIINPMPAGGRARSYRIPITRVNQFWNGDEANGYGSLTNALGATDAWTVELLWAERAEYESVNGDLTTIQWAKSQGAGGDSYFQFSVPAGLPHGNFAVKLYRNSDGLKTALWSWHFWVTDYNPNAFSASSIDVTSTNPGTIPAGVFTYPVPGGQVERYVDRGANKFWKEHYATNVMMDRSLGALDDYFTTAATSSFTGDNPTYGLLHYQFGRKDPFPVRGGTQNEQGNAGTAGKLTYGRVYVNSDDSQVTIADAVQNPARFHNRPSNGNWCSQVDATTYLWNDPNATTKSIYDPCPAGWRLPLNGTWSDMGATNVSGTNTYLTTQNVKRDLGYTYGRGIGTALKPVNGVRYWPTNAADNDNYDPAGGRIWYSATGFRNSNTGGFYGVGSYGYYWSATPGSAAGGYALSFGSGFVNPSNAGNRAYGFAVRCVSE